MRSILLNVFLVIVTLGQVFAQSKISYQAQLIDPDTSASTVPVGLANSKRLILKTSSNATPSVDTYSVREPDGTIKSLSSLTGSSDVPLDMNPSGEILFTAKSGVSNSCSVSIFTTNSELENIQLPSGLPCNSTKGKLGKNLDFALNLVDNSAQDPKPEVLITHSNGQFGTRNFVGFAAGLMDGVSALAGFRGHNLIATIVSGSTTPDFEKIIFSPSETSKTITKNSGLASDYSTLVLSSFGSNEAVLLVDDLNGCNAYVAELSKSKLVNVKRIREPGICIFASDVNKNGDAVGMGSGPFLWNRKNRLQKIAPRIKPQVTFEWSSLNFINDRGDIVGVVLTGESGQERRQTVLLTKNK